ncbi:unnamed protein product [Mesocestoides corti]|uniref:Uncharacterized protein n=1 Tax=Mesocestoides corti TaxID=53468 RepID=A0A0R3U8S1_MESCO|nr:unnamed protein product [Mesocestoides corti]
MPGASIFPTSRADLDARSTILSRSPTSSTRHSHVHWPKLSSCPRQWCAGGKNTPRASPQGQRHAKSRKHPGRGREEKEEEEED